MPFQSQSTHPECDWLVLPYESDQLTKALSSHADLAWLADHPGIEQKAKSSFTAAVNGTPNNVLLYCLGQADHPDLNRVLRECGGVIAKSTEKQVVIQLEHLQTDAARAARWITEGIVMGKYRFTELKTADDADDEPSETTYTFVSYADVNAAVTEAEIIADGVNTTRTLCNLPGNYLTPSIFAEKALALGKTTGLKVTILDEAEMESMGMGSLLSVSQGSDEPAKLIILDHQPPTPESEDVICLVGKGLTFDAGGISLKPANNMHIMKTDMSGGGAVFGAMQAIARLNLPIRVVGIIPSSENLINGKASKPGDVFTAMNGKTIEVLNTDAEGRLILADALCYAARYNPDLMIDAATLTGAIKIALGDRVTGLMTNSQSAADEVMTAGNEVDEKCWQLPMFDHYGKQLKSETADVANIGGRNAGSITAAKFLEHFVGDIPWVHLDIAGTARFKSDSSIYPEGSSGMGVRLFVRIVQNRLKQNS